MSDLTDFLLARIAEDEAAVLEPSHGYDQFPELRGRVLAECEAKRRIVQDAIDTSSASFPDYDGGYASAMEDAVAMLAQPYRDHPDFRPEWSDSPG